MRRFHTVSRASMVEREDGEYILYADVDWRMTMPARNYDIVAALRAQSHSPGTRTELEHDAADEIERLQARSKIGFLLALIFALEFFLAIL